MRSNLYVFYFDVNEEYGLKNLFISSFLELVKETELGKGKYLIFDGEVCVVTEFSTKECGRIYILISNESSALIIENKVYHKLNNNLKDYWDSIEITDENKIVIILSLKTIRGIDHNQFINITHQQFITKVMSRFGMYLPDANDKYVLFLR